jgi:hypothetical protein
VYHALYGTVTVCETLDTASLVGGGVHVIGAQRSDVLVNSLVARHLLSKLLVKMLSDDVT